MIVLKTVYGQTNPRLGATAEPRGLTGRAAISAGDTIMSIEWWQTFFSGIVLDMWQQAIPEEHTRAEAGFAQVKSYASLDKHPFKLGANQLLMEAIKAS